MAEHRMSLDDGSLVDLLDRLVTVGLVVDGSVLITLAGVDLIRLDLRALLASVETLDPAGVASDPAGRGGADQIPTGPEPPTLGTSRPTRPSAVDRPRMDRPMPIERSRSVAPPSTTAERAAAGRSAPTLDLTPDSLSGGHRDPRSGLAGLVVAVVDIVRQLLERQVIRRMDGDSLDHEQIERLGQALRELEQQTTELAEALGLRATHRTDALAGLSPTNRRSTGNRGDST